MKCEFLATSNPNFKYKIGQINDAVFTETVLYFGNFHTSYIRSIEVVGDVFHLTTRNSTYSFRVLEGTPNYIVKPKEELADIETKLQALELHLI
jgi:hypothetical protein